MLISVEHLPLSHKSFGQHHLRSLHHQGAHVSGGEGVVFLTTDLAKTPLAHLPVVGARDPTGNEEKTSLALELRSPNPKIKPGHCTRPLALKQQHARPLHGLTREDRANPDAWARWAKDFPFDDRQRGAPGGRLPGEPGAYHGGGSGDQVAAAWPMNVR